MLACRCFKDFNREERLKHIRADKLGYFGKLRLRTGLQLLNVRYQHGPFLVWGITDWYLLHHAQTTKLVQSVLPDLRCPILITQGTSDQVTDPALARVAFDLLGSRDKQLVLYEGGYHALFWDEPPVTTHLLDTITQWFRAHLDDNPPLPSQGILHITPEKEARSEVKSEEPNTPPRPEIKEHGEAKPEEPNPPHGKTSEYDNKHAEQAQGSDMATSDSGSEESNVKSPMDEHVDSKGKDGSVQKNPMIVQETDVVAA